MLHTILEGADASGHELELVFFQDGPWPQELRAAGLRVESIEAGRVRQLHRLAATVLRLAALFRERRPGCDPQLGREDAALRLARGDARGDERPGRLVAARDRRAPLARPQREPAAGARDRLLLDAPPPARRAAVAAPAHDRDPAPAPSRGARRRRSRAAELPTDVPIVGIVGRLQPWKGQDRLLRAQALLRERGQALHLVIVGGDSYGLSPEYAASLPRLDRRSSASRLGDADRRSRRRDALHRADGRARQRLRPRAVRDRAARGDGRGRAGRRRRLGRTARHRRARTHGHARALGRVRRSRGRARAAAGLAGAAPRSSATPGASASCATIRTRPCASDSSPHWRTLPAPTRSTGRGDRCRRECSAAAAARELTLVAHHVGPVGGMERVLSELALGLRASRLGASR